MTPSSDINLKNFLASYQLHESYILGCGFSYGGHMVMPPEAYLFKRQLIVRHAWEVGRHDLDSAAIHDDDDPIIPENQPDAPIFTLLNWRRTRR